MSKSSDGRILNTSIEVTSADFNNFLHQALQQHRPMPFPILFCVVIIISNCRHPKLPAALKLH